MGGTDGHLDQAQHRRMQAIGLRRERRMATIDRQGVLGQVIGAHREEVDFRRDAGSSQRRRGDLDHHADLHVAHRRLAMFGRVGGVQFGADTIDDGTRATQFGQVLDHREHQANRPRPGGRQQRPHLGLEHFRARQGEANAAQAEEGVVLTRQRPVRQRLVAADIQRACHQRPPLERIQRLTVLGGLGGEVRRLRVRHEHEFGTQQADTLGTALDGVAGMGGVAQIGDHLDMMAIQGRGGCHARLPGGGLTLLMPGDRLFGTRAATGRGHHADAASFTIDDQLAAIGDRQHARASPDHRRNAQRARQNRAVRGRPAQRRDQAPHASGIQARHIRRADVLGHQHMRCLGGARQRRIGQHAEHPPPDIAQIGGAFGQQAIGEVLLGTGGTVDGRPPRRFGAVPFIEAFARRGKQLRIAEHLLVHRENLGHLGAFGAIDQRQQLLARGLDTGHQALGLTIGAGIAARLVDEARQAHHPARRDGHARRGGHRGHHAIGGGSGLLGVAGGLLFTGLQRRGGVGAPIGQRLHRLAETGLHRAHHHAQRRLIGRRVIAGGAEDQRLAAACAQPQHLGQTGGTDHTAVIAFQSQRRNDAMLLAGFARRLHQLLGRTRMQAVGVEQHDLSQLRRGGFPRQPRQQGAGRQPRQAFACALFQQRQQALQQRLMLALLSIDCQTGQRSDAPVARLQCLLRRDDGQRRAGDILLRLRQPHALPQRHRLGGEHGRDETITDTAGLAQARGPRQHQLVTIARGEAAQQRLGIQPRRHHLAAQLAQHFLGGGRRGQALTDAIAIEHTRQRTQDVEMLIGLCRDGHQQEDAIAVVPLHALRKLQDTHPGGQHGLAAVRRTVGDRDPLPQVGGRLGFTRQQALTVVGRGAPTGDQGIGGLLQGIAPVAGMGGEKNVLAIKTEHGWLLEAPF